MKTPLTIIFTIDAKFVQHFTVTLVSVLENNKDLALTVFVIHDLEDQKILNEVSSFIKKTYDLHLNLIKVDNSVFDNYRVSMHHSKAVYFRLLITEFIPKNIDKALFLDADIVVAGSLKELAVYEFGEAQHLLAVDDVEIDEHVPRLNDLGFPVTRYFNAGVLLINVKGWRDHNYSLRFIELANEYMDRLAWWDQDILNMFFYKTWQEMDPKFNAIHLRKRLPITPVVIHYAGTSKPWLYVHEHPYKSLYWDYLKLTPFKNFTYPDHTPKEVLRKIYIKLLNTFKLRKQPVFKD